MLSDIFPSVRTADDSTLCSPSTVKRSSDNEARMECSHRITAGRLPEPHHSVCVCVFVVGRTEGNNKCVYEQPARVMDKYTFNNSPVSQCGDRPAAV